MTSLKEEGIDSIIIEQVVDPLIKVLVNGLTDDMKSIVRGDVQHSQSSFSAIQFPVSMRSQQTSSQSASSVGSSVSANSSASNFVQRMEEPRPPLQFGALAIEGPSTLPDVSDLPEAQLLHGRNEFPDQTNIATGSPIGSPFREIESPFREIGSPLLDVGSPLLRSPEDMFDFGPPKHNQPK
jgi:hypothetical protein